MNPLNPSRTNPPSLMLTAYGFIDGGYLREEGKAVGNEFPDPHAVMAYVMSAIREMGGYSSTTNSVFARRMYFYDATDPSTPPSNPRVAQYWDAIEKLNETQVRFGAVRGKPRRQKGVDLLLAVDMLVGAFNALFEVAVLVSGDEGFVPLVTEVQRRGVSVVVAAVPTTTSAELRRIADRFVDLSDAGVSVLTKSLI